MFWSLVMPFANDFQSSYRHSWKSYRHSWPGGVGMFGDGRTVADSVRVTLYTT